MRHYALFLTMAAATVLSPGPGVLLTLTNALRYGLRGAFGGILGVALGALVVAAISATSVGVILATSALAFNLLKWLGAAYLLYLGFKMWRSTGVAWHGPTGETAGQGGFFRRCGEGLSLQLTNPKAIFFFMSIFPQFIEASEAYLPQFALLVLTYASLVVLIHAGYACSARRMQLWLGSARGGQAIRRLGGATFMVFGAMMACAQR